MRDPGGHQLRAARERLRSVNPSAPMENPRRVLWYGSRGGYPYYGYGYGYPYNYGYGGYPYYGYGNYGNYGGYGGYGGYGYPTQERIVCDRIPGDQECPDGTIVRTNADGSKTCCPPQARASFGYPAPAQATFGYGYGYPVRARFGY